MIRRRANLAFQFYLFLIMVMFDLFSATAWSGGGGGGAEFFVRFMYHIDRETATFSRMGTSSTFQFTSLKRSQGRVTPLLSQMINDQWTLIAGDQQAEALNPRDELRRSMITPKTLRLDDLHSDQPSVLIDQLQCKISKNEINFKDDILGTYLITLPQTCILEYYTKLKKQKAQDVQELLQFLPKGEDSSFEMTGLQNVPLFCQKIFLWGDFSQVSMIQNEIEFTLQFVLSIRDLNKADEILGTIDQLKRLRDGETDQGPDSVTGGSAGKESGNDSGDGDGSISRESNVEMKNDNDTGSMPEGDEESLSRRHSWSSTASLRSEEDEVYFSDDDAW